MGVLPQGMARSRGGLPPTRAEGSRRACLPAVGLVERRVGGGGLPAREVREASHKTRRACWRALPVASAQRLDLPRFSGHSAK